MEPGLLTTTAAAAAAGVSTPTWRRIAETHQLRPVTHEGSRAKWWRKADIERFLLGDQEMENA